MTTIDEDQRRSTKVRASILAGALLVSVGVVGWTTGTHFGTNESNYYATVSQVIATLFVAIFLESFTGEHPLWETGIERFLVLALLVCGLLGLFACVRGLLGHGNGMTTGLAAAGLVACLLLVAQAVTRRVRAFTGSPAADGKDQGIMFLFVITSQIVLVYLP